MPPGVGLRAGDWEGRHSSLEWSQGIAFLVVGLLPRNGIELGPAGGVERDFHVRDPTLGRQSTQRLQPEAVVACRDAGVRDERDHLSGLFTKPSSASAALLVVLRQRS